MPSPSDSSVLPTDSTNGIFIHHLTTYFPWTPEVRVNWWVTHKLPSYGWLMVFSRTSTACFANPDQHRQADFQRRCTINMECFTELRSPKWQFGHLQINRTVHNCLWLLGRNVTSPSASVPTQRRHYGALKYSLYCIVLYCKLQYDMIIIIIIR